MINILFSGVNKQKGFNDNQKKYLQKYIKNNKKIVFIASVFNDFEKSQYNFERFVNYFKKCNINFSKADLIDGRKNLQESNKVLKECNYVFLLGGSPELQMKSINDYNLVDNIKNKEVIIGVSAGSMNQSNRVVYKDDFDNYKLKDYRGLNLVDINVFPHFDLNSSEFVAEAKELSYIVPLTLLPNDSFIVVDKEIKIIGENYFIKDGKINRTEY